MERLCRVSLNAFSIASLRIARVVSAWPKSFTAVLIVATLAFASQTSKLKFLFSADDMDGGGILTAAELKSLKERYQDGPASILMLTPPEGQFSFSVRELCEIRKWYSLVRLTHPQFKNASSTFDAVWMLQTPEKAIKYGNVLSLDCDRDVVTPDLREAKAALDRTPWPALRESSDRLSLLFVFIYQNANDPKFGSFNPLAVGGIRKSVEADVMKIVPGAKVHWVGSADYQWYVKKGFERSVWINTGMIVLLLIALRIFYGTWISGFMFCGSLIVAGIWIFGGKAILDSPYDVMSTGLFLLLGVSAIEDFTFLSSEQMKGASWRAARRRLLIPAFFTSLTTIVGFLSLCFSDIALIRSFGAWSAYGVLLEWVMIFFFLPAVLELGFKGKRWVDPSRAISMRFLTHLSIQPPPRWLVRGSLMVFPFAVVAFNMLNANDVASRVFPRDHEYNVGLRELEKSRGWLGFASLLFTHPVPGEEVDRVAQAMKADPALKGSLVDFESANRIAEWLASPGLMSRSRIDLDYGQTLSRKQLVDSEGVPRANLYINDVSVDGLQALKASAARACPNGECRLAGDLAAFSDLAVLIPKTLLDSLVGSLVIVAIIVGFLALALRQQRALIPILVSSFWGPCVMIVVLAATQEPMDFLKCVFAAILVGLTGDNAIQYLFASRSKRGALESGIADRGLASIITTALMVGISLMYLFSYFNPPRSFGLILAGGLTMALLGDLWLLNGLLDRRPAKS